MRRLAGQALRRTASGLHFAARFVLAVLVLAMVAVAALTWRLAQGPLELPWLMHRIDAMAAGGPGGWSIGGASLAWDGFNNGVGRPLRIHLAAVVLKNDQGGIVAQVPEAQVTLSFRELLLGRVAPVTIELRGAVLHAVRGEDGVLTLSVGGGSPGDDGQPEPLADLAAQFARPELTRADVAEPTGKPSPFARLQRIAVRGAALTVEDRRLGITWNAPEVTAELRRRRDGGADMTGDVRLALGTQATTVTARGLLRPPGQGASLDFRFGPLTPARLAADLHLLPALAMADLPVVLAGSVDLAADFSPLRATATATIGAGTLAIARGTIPIGSAVVEISATPQAAELTLVGAELVPKTGLSTHLTGQASVRRTSGMLTADVTIDADPIDFRAVPELWPDGIGGPGAKPWIVENIPSGIGEDLHVTTSLYMRDDFSDVSVGAIAGGMNGRDLTVHWLRPVPPLEHAVARLEFISPDILDIAVLAGRQGAITVQSGLVHFTGLAVRDQLASIAVDLTAPLGDLVALLRHPRLHLLDKSPIELRNPTGQVRGHLEINQLPLEFVINDDDIHLSANAHLSGVHLAAIAAGLDLDDGQLDLDVTSDGLKLAGTGRLGGIDAKLVTDMNFRPVAVGQINQTIALSGTAGIAQLAAAGLDLSSVMTGSLDADLTYRIRRGGRPDLLAKLDLGQAVLAVPQLNFTKPAGKPAQAELRVVLDRGRPTAIDALRLQGDGISAEGSIGFADGRPASARLSRLVLGRNTNARADIKWPARAGGPWQISLDGASVDASAQFRHHEPPAQNPPPGPPYQLDARLARIVLGEGRGLNDVTLHIESDGKVTSQARLAGQTVSGGKFDLQVAPAPPGRQLTARAADAGGLLRALDIVDDMQGGAMALTGRFDDTRADHMLAAHAEITGFRLLRAPAMARLLQAMTLYGLVQLIEGPGLGFSQLEASFRMADDILTLDEARAFNPSLGMTAQGTADLARGRCDLRGTIIPAYFFNSLLGNIPLIGRLFTAEKGGGLVSANYTLRGPCSDPAVSINPLSTLTPGFLRNIFGAFDNLPASSAPAKEESAIGGH